jgi:hypothetical protein
MIRSFDHCRLVQRLKAIAWLDAARDLDFVSSDNRVVEDV